MQRFILHRLLQGIVLLFCVAIIVFALGRLTGNPADLMLPEDATAEDREHLLRALGGDAFPGCRRASLRSCSVWRSWPLC